MKDANYTINVAKWKVFHSAKQLFGDSKISVVKWSLPSTHSCEAFTISCQYGHPRLKISGDSLFCNEKFNN